MWSWKRVVLVPALLSSASASAQELTPVLRTGATVAGDVVTRLFHAVVDDDGGWSVRAELLPTLFPTPTAIVRDGHVLLRSGDEFLPPRTVWLLQEVFGRSERVGLVLADDFYRTVVSWDTRVAFVEGELAHVRGLPAHARLRHFGPVIGYGANADALVCILRLDTGQTALVRVQYSPAGTALSRTAELVTGDLLSDGARVLEFIGALRLPVNAGGDWLTVVLGDDGEQRLVSGHVVLLKTGTPSPVPGRTLEEFDWLASLDNNDLGGLSARVGLSGDPATDQLLIKNSVAFAQEGEVLPALAPHRLVDIVGPQLDDSGAVVWIAVTDAPAGHEVALMRDHQALVVVGSTRIAGRLVQRLDFSSTVSPSGRHWLGQVTLEGLPYSFLVRGDFGSAVPLPGCTPNTATLRTDGGLVLAGRTVELVMDGPAPLGSLARLHLAFGTARPLDCGRATPFGELFVDPARIVAVLPGGTFASQPVRIPLAIPADPALVDLELVAQGSFASPSGVVLTNGMALAIGAP